jgi:type VI secretion system protein ImpH
MATASGSKNPPVIELETGPEVDAAIGPGIGNELAEQLRREPWCFEFFQAVRLLERIYENAEPVGHFSPPRTEVVRFRANPSTVFPASEIQSLTEEENQTPVLEVNFMGLFGPIGVLPLYYTELIAERARQRDTSVRDFLDLFNHRMISLFYRAWEKYRFPIAYERGELDHFSHRLLDLIGLGTPGLQNRQAVPDDALIFYSGLLSQQPRSAVSLEGLLVDYFGVPVEVEQFIGAWYRLDPSTQCCMREGRDVSEQLGFGAVVGDEIWDTQARVRIKIGPLPLETYLDFLPSGTAYEPLRAITELYAGQEIDFEVQLILDRASVPQCELGAEGDEAPRLGWLTWAKSVPMQRHPDETILLL